MCYSNYEVIDVKIVTEETRKKMSESAKKRCTAEWRKRKSEKMVTKINTGLVKHLYGLGLTQGEIAEKLGVSQKVIWRHMKNNGIKSRIAAKRDQRKENNHMWKGDKAGYKAMHLRVESEKGKAETYGCSVCGTTESYKAYDWANLSGQYQDINDYAPMCRSCHRKYDKERRDRKCQKQD